MTGNCLVAAAFIIEQTPRKLCLSTDTSRAVLLEPCGPTRSAQQWRWTGGRRLLHVTSSHCLSADPHGLAGGRRAVRLSPCQRAPAWRCSDPSGEGGGGSFGLAEEPRVYLGTWGTRAVIWYGSRDSNWTRYNEDPDSGGQQMSLCQAEGEEAPGFVPIVE
ncbi:hypothetical protein NHX12_003114 [Muraenolepis orangiensis]|uniref:Ricin B lectin domain-containing protein n=1 Tax=Muraenolepis orangiensis TaxID=630683 RepID=A0A9Q0IFW0_9TELE|nr:hypothetical protein NHX12_003114 [Muraenolepis orangiensis]